MPCTEIRKAVLKGSGDWDPMAVWKIGSEVGGGAVTACEVELFMGYFLGLKWR
jgi:hypothetical protein